jgi:hypothetical protein
MPIFDCAVGESLRLGSDIRLNLTGRDGDTLYVFIDAASHHTLGGTDGLYLSAPCGNRRRTHVLALRDDASFSIGPVDITVEAVRLRIPGASALRDVSLYIALSSPLIIVRQAPSLRRRYIFHPAG